MECNYKGCEATAKWVIDPYADGNCASFGCDLHLLPFLKEYLSDSGESWAIVNMVGAKKDTYEAEG